MFTSIRNWITWLLEWLSNLFDTKYPQPKGEQVMSALSIQPTYPIFTDIDGQPLEDGYVWIGASNLDPQTNPIAVYWDSALTLPAAQPIRTLAGYPSNTGTPARLYTNGDYSIRVMNKKGSVIYSAPESTEAYGGIITADQVGYSPSGASAVDTDVQSKLRERVSVFDYMTPAQIADVRAGTALLDVTASIQTAIDENNAKQIVFPTGTYAVGSTINIDNCYCYFAFEKAIIKPIANNFTIFKAVVNAYGVKFFDLIVRGAGTTGVTVFDVFRMVRQGAGIIRPDIDSVQTGIFLNGLAYGIDIDAPNIFNVDNPIIVKAAAGAVKINHPIIDMNGKAGVGIDIYGATLPVEGPIQNVGTQIIGGACEGGTIGIRDASFNTQVYGTYFERNSEADISLVGSKMFGGIYTNHTAAVGAVGIKARNTDAAQIYHPFMSSGGRSTGLLDFDGTNTNCYYDVLFGASSFNLPLGVVTGINNQTNKPGPIGGVTRNDGKFSTLSSTGITEFTRSRTASNPLTIATATPTTFLTLPGVGQYEIHAYIAFSGSAADYTSTATVICDGNGARIIANNGVKLPITLSGLDVRVEQTSGSNQTVQFAYSRIS